MAAVLRSGYGVDPATGKAPTLGKVWAVLQKRGEYGLTVEFRVSFAEAARMRSELKRCD